VRDGVGEHHAGGEVRGREDDRGRDGGDVDGRAQDAARGPPGGQGCAPAGDRPALRTTPIASPRTTSTPAPTPRERVLREKNDWASITETIPWATADSCTAPSSYSETTKTG